MREDWTKCTYGDLLGYEQPTNYIVVSTAYNDSFEIPVLTAGKSFIKGYTNERDGVFDKLPTIIFDDFTTASQFVNFKFKVKSSAMKILVPKSTLVNIKFVFWSMQVNRVRSDTHKRYWISIFSKKKLQLPPLPEQRAIVAKIEELFSSLDQGIADLKKAQEQLKVYRQAVFSSLIPETCLRPVSDVVEDLSQGWSPKCINKSSEDFDQWAVIKTSAIQAGGFVQEANKILPEPLEPRTQHEIKEGDILITRAGPRVRVGVCCLVRETRPKLINCDKVYRIRLDHGIITGEFFEFVMNSPRTLSLIERIKSGTNDSGLNLTQRAYLGLDIPVPPLKNQLGICKNIESRLSICDKVEEIIKISLEQANGLKQSVLKKAFEGVLLTQDEIEKCKGELDYQPASELLKTLKRR